ncbi:MAG: citrate synthase [Beduini sp.]|uniref:citrate synthase n=1 Tax=Beduini sp. TaxID=1922300 RepID=UPI0011C9ED6E
METSISTFFNKALLHNDIKNQLYKDYDVKKGLRNEDGTGVLVGLTTIADVVGYTMADGVKKDCIGDLYYRGISIKDIINNKGSRLIYEEVCFLILFGYLPNALELEAFTLQLRMRYHLPEDFLQSQILRHPASNLMNKLQQDILALYAYDEQADDVSPLNTLEQGLNLLAQLMSITIYDYHVKVHHFDHQSLYIHHIKEDYSIAENILYLLRPDQSFSENEASVLDTLLVLHADHGGGNNSTFTNVVISSTGTDIYSAFAGSVGSLKGPRHGGANLAARKMMLEVMKEIGMTDDHNLIREMIIRILNKEANDHSGLVYGMGHAIYTLSDPRSELMAKECEKLAIEKGRVDEYRFYRLFDQVAAETIKEIKGTQVCSNFDFYSGLVYDMLGIPTDLYPLLFVVSRSVGWLAHNIENKLYADRIIRPATQYVGKIKKYIDISER